MKKVWIIACTVLVLVFSFALLANANEYTLSQTAVPPTIDGVVNETEWKGATHNYMSGTEGNVYSSTQYEIEGNASFDTYMTWYYDGSDERSGLYLAVVAHDTSKGYGYNENDLPQWGISPWFIDDCDKVVFLIDPYYMHGEDTQGCLLITVLPWTLVDCTGRAVVYDQNYLKTSTMTNVTFACKSTILEKEYTGYSFELFVPFSALSVDDSKEAPHDIDTQIGLGMCVFDSFGSSISYYASDFGVETVDFYSSFLSSRYYNTVILGDIDYDNIPDDYVEVDRSEYVNVRKAADMLLMNSAAYTDESVDLLQEAMDDTANYIYNIKQSVMDGYTKLLSAALTKMVSKNYPELQTLLSSVSSLKQSDFSADSWKVFSAAKASAAAMTSTDDADALAKALDTLKNAYINLVYSANGEHIVDTAAADEVLAYYEDIKALRSNYTTETWNNYEQAVNALSSLTKVSATQSEYDAAVQSVSEARENLARVSSLIPDGNLEQGMDVVLLIYIIVVSAAVLVAALVIILKLIKKKQKTAQ